MARIRVSIINSKNFAKDQLSFIKKLSDKQLFDLAKNTTDEMKTQIKGSINRSNSTGALEDSISFEKISDGYGVGNISEMNQNVPYWRHVNFGSQAIGANHDHRVPTGAFTRSTGGRWQVESGNFSFIPTKPIAPLNYIDKTVQQIPRLVKQALSRRV